jgi:hypothetical protein
MNEQRMLEGEEMLSAGRKYALGACAHTIDKRLSIVTVNAFQLHAKNFFRRKGE